MWLRRALLDTLLDSMDASSAALQPGITVGMDVSQTERSREDVPGSSQTARILNLFAFLMNQVQAAVKAAVLYLPQTGYDRLTDNISIAVPHFTLRASCGNKNIN